jgi:hypothetical protein
VKFILIVLTLQGTPQYAIGPHDTHLACMQAGKGYVAAGGRIECVAFVGARR